MSDPSFPASQPIGLLNSSEKHPTLPEKIEDSLWYFLGHTPELAKNAVGFTQHLGMNEDKVQLFRAAAPLHDLGKLYLPIELLLKPDRLTNEEFELMRTHVTIGLQHLMKVYPHAPLVLQNITQYHHERIDGQGTHRLSASEIPEEARIFAILDVYDALRTKRSYKSAWSEEKALAEIVRCSGSQFDPELVFEFSEYIKKFLEHST